MSLSFLALVVVLLAVWRSRDSCCHLDRARKLMGENLKVVGAEFTNLS